MKTPLFDGSALPPFVQSCCAGLARLRCAKPPSIHWLLLHQRTWSFARLGGCRARTATRIVRPRGTGGLVLIALGITDRVFRWRIWVPWPQGSCPCHSAALTEARSFARRLSHLEPKAISAAVTRCACPASGTLIIWTIRGHCPNLAPSPGRLAPWRPPPAGANISYKPSGTPGKPSAMLIIGGSCHLGRDRDGRAVPTGAPDDPRMHQGAGKIGPRRWNRMNPDRGATAAEPPPSGLG